MIVVGFGCVRWPVGCMPVRQRNNVAANFYCIERHRVWSSKVMDTLQHTKVSLAHDNPRNKKIHVIRFICGRPRRVQTSHVRCIIAARTVPHAHNGPRSSASSDMAKRRIALRSSLRRRVRACVCVLSYDVSPPHLTTVSDESLHLL